MTYDQFESEVDKKAHEHARSDQYHRFDNEMKQWRSMAEKFS